MANHGSLLMLAYSVWFCRDVLSQSQVCFWGDTSLNGLYTYSGVHNQKPYYTKANETCYPIFYMYYVDTPRYAWHIHTSLNDNTDVWAYCNSYNTSDPITSCSEWQVWDWYYNIYKSEANVFTRLNSCPSWNCDQISIPSLPNECNVTFDEYLSDNTWRNSLNGLHWYFNTMRFRWECVNTYPDVCKDSPLTYTYGWTDVPNDTASVDFAFAAPNINSHTVNCIVIPPSTSPTSLPSKTPYQAPTYNPITLSTSTPSKAPSKSPTDFPSTFPNSPPSVSPNAPHSNSIVFITILFHSCGQEHEEHACDINKTTITSQINDVLVAYNDYNSTILSS
eukprot:102887_1